MTASTAEKLQTAFALHREGKLKQAAALYRAVLDQTPESVEALHFLGVIALKEGRLQEAERLIAKALSVRPDYAAAAYDLGNVLRAQKRPEQALASFDKALSLRPEFAEAWNNRGGALSDLERPADALASYDRAIALKPDHAKALHNRGNALRDLKRLDEALAAYDRALAVAPDYSVAHFSRANVLRDMGRVEEALAGYGRAIAIEPGYAEAHWNESICRLLAGDLARGFEQYEWRWRRGPQLEEVRQFPAPLWLGAEDLRGKTVLLHAEQGYGDTIQFVRYVPLLAAKGAEIVLEVQPPLKPLLAGSTGVRQVVARGERLPAFDFHCPLMSLALACGTSLATVPARVPYLQPAAERLASWRGELERTGAPRIGLAWSGNPTHRNDRNRSIAANLLTPLLDAGGTFVSVQKEPRPDDRRWLAAHPEIVHLGDRLRDFADTAALLSQLDLVITVDTAVAHLAGALGKPVWILLPWLGVDWRWMLERADSPWYPTARLFRQPAIDDWASVIETVAGELRAHNSPR